MSKHGLVFAGTFLPAAAAVGTAVALGRPFVAVAAGTAGVLLHWAISARHGHDGELADASYFFGFLLTLVFLAVGLFALSGAGQPADVQRTGPSVVLRFLEDLAAGLVLTIVGLMVRQIRTLSTARGGEAGAGSRDDSLTDAQRELASAMRVLVQTLQRRPEEVAARELDDTRAKARAAAEGLEHDIALAAKRIDGAMTELEGAVTTVTGGLMRATSGLGDSLALTTQRIQIEVEQVLALIAGQRKELQTIDAEYRRGLAGFSSAGTAFAGLADQVAKEVQALPNPAERLTGLWDGVRALETTLSNSIGGAVEQLDALRQRSDELSVALTRLGTSTGTAAGHIEAGGSKLGESLQQELRKMNEILDEYTNLLEQRVATYGGR